MKVLLSVLSLVMCLGVTNVQAQTSPDRIAQTMLDSSENLYTSQNKVIKDFKDYGQDGFYLSTSSELMSPQYIARFRLVSGDSVYKLSTRPKSIIIASGGITKQLSIGADNSIH